MKNQHLFLLCLMAISLSCEQLERPDFPQVTADVETEAVDALQGEDAADDATIWINPQDSSQSVIIGTVKGYGLEVYNLQGERLHQYEVGSPNNIDLRYDFVLENGDTVDIVACSERVNDEVLIYSIDPSDYSLQLRSANRLKSSVDEVYGLSFYKSPVDSTFYVFVNGKDGNVEQWQLQTFEADGITGEVVRRLNVNSQPEGMVADAFHQIVYIGEEMRGIWKFAAEPDQPTDMTFIAQSDEKNTNITYDIEGLTIYHATDSTGYLIASSQGNHSYAVFERAGDNAYLGSFVIGDSEQIDGTFDTDGIDVTPHDLGAPFTSGLFIVQDGYNKNAEGEAVPQNFKLIAWEKVAEVIRQFGE